MKVMGWEIHDRRESAAQKRRRLPTTLHSFDDTLVLD